MSFERLIAQLIVDHEWDAAIQTSSKYIETAEQVRTLSLLYRYKNYLDRDQTLIQNCALTSQYIQERFDFFKRPIFEQLQTRQKLCMPKDLSKTPRPDTLEQLCFVTAGGSDQPYFNLLWQLLESIKNTKTYGSIPIMIFDCGLTDDDKHKLHQAFDPVTILDPGWDVDTNIAATRITKNGLKGCTARPFMDRHFPDYRYYMWLDTDVWIQDERALDYVLQQAEETGLGYVQDHLYNVWSNSFWDMNNRRKPIIPDTFSHFLNNKETVTGGTFCIDKLSGFFLKWQENFKTAVTQCEFTWGTEEVTFLYTVNQAVRALQPISRTHQFSGCFYGFPIIHDDSQVLYTPDTNQIIGIVHLTGFLALKLDPLIPVVCLPKEQALPVQMLDQNKQAFNHWLNCHVKGIATQNSNTFQNMQTTSFHYRTWPWVDKPEILDLLMQEAQKVLQ